MQQRPRVGVITGIQGKGGLQGVIIETILGLNERGVVPDILWDQPCKALEGTAAKANLALRKFRLPTPALRKLSWSSYSKLLSIALFKVDLRLREYDFIYNFEARARMERGVPNICWVTGPDHLPELDETPYTYFPVKHLRLKRLARKLLLPQVTFDPNATYILQSRWTADLFEQRYRHKVKIVWPPARHRGLARGFPRLPSPSPECRISPRSERITTNLWPRRGG